MASIRKRKNKYQVQIRRNGFPDLSKSFEQLRDAKEWARHTEIKLDRNELAPNRKELDHISLGDLVIRYRDTVLPEKRSQEVETIVLNAFLRHPMCRKPLSHISTGDFAQYRDQRLTEISPISLKRQLAPLHNMFEVAGKEWNIPIRENPLSKLKLRAPENKRERRLKHGELERLLEAGRNLKNPYVIPIILFALETAMRRGEILSLHWGHIDLERSSAIVLDAKNGYSRSILLSPRAVALLDHVNGFWKERTSNHGSLHKEAIPKINDIYQCLNEKGIGNVIESNYDNYLRVTKDNSNVNPSKEIRKFDRNLTDASVPVFPLTSNALRLSWGRLVKSSKIDNLHFHDLRHECISRLFELGLTVPEIASISGHRDMRMLFRYAHSRPENFFEKLSR